ncbi:glycosyltransferase [Acidimicrobiia bacterium]|nr:glycosyltransferase [Acidimicrobiia bacterium]
MKSVTYFYAGSRKRKIESSTEEAKEHYYSYHSFLEDNYKMDVVEFNQYDTLISKILYIYDRILNKFFSIPSYSHKVCTYSNYKKIKKSDIIFLVNEGVAFSVLPMLFFIKKSHKTQINIFSMGLFSKKPKKGFRNLNKMYIKLLVSCISNVLFLGKGELKKAKDQIRSRGKFKFIGFSVDTEFWNSSSELKRNKNQILFVGNDSNKDASMILKICELLPEYNFICISKLKILKLKKLNNLIVLDGEWNNSVISDKKLKDYYETSFLTISPLVESYQPSGQSVSLQSMSMGTPAVISKTEGFWDYDAFIDNKNIFFIDSNDPNLWAEKILELSSNQEIIKKVSLEGKKLVVDEYNLNIFYKNLKNITDI